MAPRTIPRTSGTPCGISLDSTIRKCLRILNVDEHKGTKLIGLDEWYVPKVEKNVAQIKFMLKNFTVWDILLVC